MIIAPEVCITGFDYAHFEKAEAFSKRILSTLLPLTKGKALLFTVIENRQNVTYFLQNEEILYKRAKYNLFLTETKHFVQGTSPELFHFEEFKVGILICFELRFVEYWTRFRSADLILVPAMWGVERKEHFHILLRALALSNQCFVIASDSANEDMAKNSGFFSPWGEFMINDHSESITKFLDLKEIKRVRKKLPLF